MKTVKQASIDIIREYDLNVNFWQDNFDAGMEDGLIEGFVRGVEWAQRWISAEEELPEPNSSILVKTAFFRMFVARRSGNYFITEDNRTVGGVTHWRPIEFNNQN